MRWRFLHAGRLHLALAPSGAATLGYESHGSPDDPDSEWQRYIGERDVGTLSIAWEH